LYSELPFDAADFIGPARHMTLDSFVQSRSEREAPISPKTARDQGQ
jgi:hypothetical protein